MSAIKQDVDFTIDGSIVYESSKEPLRFVEISLYGLRKPLFSVREWKLIEIVKTDENGYFLFKVGKAGAYEIRWNPESDILTHELPIEVIERNMTIEILHKDKQERKYPWDT